MRSRRGVEREVSREGVRRGGTRLERGGRGGGGGLRGDWRRTPSEWWLSANMFRFVSCGLVSFERGATNAAMRRMTALHITNST